MAVDIHAAPGRRILFTASTWSHLANFHRPYLRALADRGYLVDGACGGAPADLPELARAVPLSLEKKMTSPKNLAAAAQIRRLLASGEYDLVSCHTALAAFFTRLAVEALPGQYDQRADSCEQCIQLQSGVDRPIIATAKVYLLMGTISQEDLEKIRKYLINPVESRKASMDKPETLERTHAAPDHVDTVEGFIAMDEKALEDLLSRLGLAMDLDDLKFLQTYFRDQEKRDPTITEIRVVDTYWSDHCRHTTFSTHLDHVEINDPAVQAAYNRYLAAREEAWRTTHGTELAFDGEGFLHDAKEHLSRSPWGVTVAMSGDEFAGLLQLDTQRYQELNAGYIPFCYIAPSRREQNLGVQLIGQAVSFFRPLGRDKLRLRCAPYNDRAQHFYQKYGFVKVGEEQGSRVPLDIMEKYIGYDR